MLTDVAGPEIQSPLLKCTYEEFQHLPWLICAASDECTVLSP